MNLRPIDWTIIGLFIGGMILIALFTRQYMKSVADFLAANRLAGRYLLTVSHGMGGAVSNIAVWEMVYLGGLPTQWWGLMSLPVALILALTGFATYRFRQTRAFTLAQFFEMRYSRNFRVFAGMLCFLAGILNYGIFPAITASFIISFFGLPPTLTILSLSLGTFPLVMAGELILALTLVLSGGQITILLTEFYQGMLAMIVFVAVLCFLMARFSWVDIVTGLQAAPAGHSMIDPFQTSGVRDFNFWYFVINIILSIYGVKSWQGSSASNSAPRTPHEAQMAGILSNLRTFIQGVLLIIIPLTAYAVMHHAKFAHIANEVTIAIGGIHESAGQARMIVPVVLSYLLPTGLIGLFAAVMITSAVNTDETYLHSWGTIFIQDVIMPLWPRPLSTRAHLLLLRLSIVFVAAFGFFCSLCFGLKDYILMFFNLTGAIFLGGAGAVILGGLYWKRGTTAGAWVAMLTGSVFAFGGLLTEQLWKSSLAPTLLHWFPACTFLHAHQEKFLLNGTEISFLAMLLSITSYVAVSLLGPKTAFDMDKLLHRGAYAEPADHVIENPKAKRTLGTLLGITPEFTRGDKTVFWGAFSFNMLLWLCFLIGTLGATFLISIPLSVWTGFWFFKIWLSFLLGIGITVWFLWGGIIDALQLFRDLRKERVNESDDGVVKAPGSAH